MVFSTAFQFLDFWFQAGSVKIFIFHADAKRAFYYHIKFIFENADLQQKVDLNTVRTLTVNSRRVGKILYIPSANISQRCATGIFLLLLCSPEIQIDFWLSPTVFMCLCFSWEFGSDYHQKCAFVNQQELFSKGHKIVPQSW